jgi:hypothetical protein
MAALKGRAVQASLLYFVAVFAAGFALGVPRTLWLEPRLGALAAVALELPLMLGWAWWVAGRLQRRLGLELRTAVATGALALAWLLAAEAALSVGLAGRSLADHLALYAQPAHQLGLAGQLLFAAWPAVRVRRAAASAAAAARCPPR